MMLRRLRFILAHRGLLLEHAVAYGQLARAEGAHWWAVQVRRFVCVGVAAGAALSLLLSSAVALAALALQPPSTMWAPWLLLVLPGLSAAALVWSLAHLHGHRAPRPLERLAGQWALDSATWRRAFGLGERTGPEPPEDEAAR